MWTDDNPEPIEMIEFRLARVLARILRGPDAVRRICQAVAVARGGGPEDIDAAGEHFVNGLAMFIVNYGPIAVEAVTALADPLTEAN